jgi:general secretion pathway protein H
MPRCGRSGFTLIEMLVVIVVIGLAAGVAVVNFGSDDRRAAEGEAKRLAAALEHAAELAQWRGEMLGVSADGTGYRFWRRGAGDAWTPLGDDEELAPRAMPAQWSVRPESFAGAPVPADAILPFRASGRNEPYALLLATPELSLVIAGDPLNRVQFAAVAASR